MRRSPRRWLERPIDFRCCPLTYLMVGPEILQYSLKNLLITPYISHGAATLMFWAQFPRKALHTMLHFESAEDSCDQEDLITRSSREVYLPNANRPKACKPQQEAFEFWQRYPHRILHSSRSYFTKVKCEGFNLSL